MNSLTSNLPLTKYRIFIAKILYKLLFPFLPSEPFVIERRSIKYEVDLREGIDFSLFLFGGFQTYIFKSPLVEIPQDGVVIDVGANIGVMALNFAKHLGNEGRVLAIEPTDYACKKLIRNLQLNPELERKIKVEKKFITSKDNFETPGEAYSSWRIDGKGNNEHPIHGGSKQKISSTTSVSIDKICQDLGLERVDFIKMDTDGFEWDVLRGAQNTVKRFAPQIVFECGYYLCREKKVNPELFYSFLLKYGYSLYDSNYHKLDSAKKFEESIPKNSTKDYFGIVDYE